MQPYPGPNARGSGPLRESKSKRKFGLKSRNIHITITFKLSCSSTLSQSDNPLSAVLPFFSLPLSSNIVGPVYSS